MVFSPVIPVPEILTRNKIGSGVGLKIGSKISFVSPTAHWAMIFLAGFERIPVYAILKMTFYGMHESFREYPSK